MELKDLKKALKAGINRFVAVHYRNGNISQSLKCVYYGYRLAITEDGIWVTLEDLDDSAVWQGLIPASWEKLNDMTSFGRPNETEHASFVLVIGFWRRCLPWRKP